MALTLRTSSLIDGTGADPRSDLDVVVNHDRVVDIAAPQASADEVIDLRGLTVLPGLIDAHTHLGIIDVGTIESPAAITAARIFRNCELALDAGFTTVRDVGGIDGGVASAVELGLIRGPRIFPSGPVLCQTGGHGDERFPFGPDHGHFHEAMGIPGLAEYARACDGPDAVRLAARWAFRRGATQIKVCVSGGVVSLTDSLEDTQFTVAELMAAVEEADARGTYVTAHAHNSRGIRNGLDAGVRCFEHASYLDEVTARALADAGASIVPTLTVAHLFLEEADAWNVPVAMRPRIAGLEQAMGQSLKLARDCGVRVGLGTDLLGPEQNRRGLELVLRAALADPMEAIVSSTAVNASIMGQAADIGTIEPGKRADVIAVDGDPMAHPELFDDPSRVVFVMKDGAVAKDTRGR